MKCKETISNLLVLFFSSTCSASRFNASAKLFVGAGFIPANDEIDDVDQLKDIWNDLIIIFEKSLSLSTVKISWFSCDDKRDRLLII